MVKFSATKAEYQLIVAIAARAVKMAKKDKVSYDAQTCMMDLDAAHSNDTPLDFQKLLDFKDSDFGHDVYGIRRFLDRNTGKLGGFFVPRCAARVNKHVLSARR